MLLAFLALSGTGLAQEPEGGLGAHTGTLLGAFWVLAALLVALVVWEVLARRSAAGPPLLTPATEEPPAGGPEAPASLEDEDPFKALLRKTAAPEKEPAEQKVPGSLEEVSMTRPAGSTPPPRSEEPVAPVRPDDVEELSPFQRLAQIGSEETGSVLSVPSEGRLEVPSPVTAPSSGGDWAALLSKVQAEDEPPAPPSPVSLKAPEEDPWKKLLGQTAPAEATGAPKSEVDEDPWKSLLTKASAESQPPVASETPTALPSGPPAPPSRIQLGPSPPSSPPVAVPTSPGPAESETGRPRTISLDLKREEGRPKPPPPQTEEE